MLKDNEQIYDEQISPLMTKIIQVCKDNNIPMFATFAYKDEKLCTTSLPPSQIGADSKITETTIVKLYNTVYKQADVYAFTITTGK